MECEAQHPEEDGHVRGQGGGGGQVEGQVPDGERVVILSVLWSAFRQWVEAVHILIKEVHKSIWILVNLE